ncbi:MAG: fibronectin type III domain-containing protein [Bacteroidales bacterium]|nr:fibronectin type III domain-containing protein [Bacteroidales bacterium]
MDRLRLFLCIYLIGSAFLLQAQNTADYQNKQSEKVEMNYEDFRIIFHQDLENTPVGYYEKEQWQKDWNNPSYAHGVYTGDRTIIIDYNAGGRISRGMKWTFPKNTVGTGIEHGYGWRPSLDNSYEECYLSFSIMFKPGFNAVRSGKLPGLQGGHMKSMQKPAWDDGFNGSLIWKHSNLGDENNPPMPGFYVYHQDQELTVGDSPRWNGYTFDVSTEIWYDITYRVVMNTATATDVGGPDGKKDGILEGFVNGELWGQVKNLRLRNLARIGIDKIRVQAFFGGSSEKYQTARDEWMLIDNVMVWTYSDEYLKKHPEVKRGRQANTVGDIIYTPFDVLLGENQNPGSDPIESDEQSPSKPSGLQAIDSTGNSITISWNPASDNVGVTGYKIYTNDEISGATGNTRYTVKSLSPGTKYKLAVSAFDAESNESPRSNAINVFTRMKDTIPPTVPSGLIVERITSSSIDFKWNASQDNVGIYKYEIYIDGTPEYNTDDVYISIGELQANTTYKISVRAYDTSNNRSSLSNAISATTKGPDTEPPTSPSGLKVNEVTETTIGIQWDPSSDNIGVRYYKIYANNVEYESSENTDVTLTDLEPGLNYTISVSAVDEADNESARSTSVKVTTKNNDLITQPTLPTISIINLQNNTISPNITTEIGSLGFTELKNYGIEITEKDNLTKETIVLQGIESTRIIHENRIKKGLQLLYNFAEGRGNTVRDISGSEYPMDLHIDREGMTTEWLKGQGLRIIDNTIITSRNSPTRLMQALSATNEITLEVWVKQEKIGQSGPARLVTLSADNSRRAITLAHEGNKAFYNYVSRLNTSSTDINGTPEIKTSQNFVSSSLHHVVYTRNNLGTEKIYINGVVLASGDREGDFSSWESDYQFALANELTGERPWKGIFYLVAVYDRALNSEEVNQNYQSGFGKLRFTTELDTLESNVAYSLKPFITTDQGLVYGEEKDFIYQNVNQLDGDFAFYPNPNNGSIFLTVKNTDENIKQGYLKITDFSGALHFTKVLDFSEGLLEKVIELRLPDSLKDGLYSLILITGSRCAAQKFILMR